MLWSQPYFSVFIETKWNGRLFIVFGSYSFGIEGTSKCRMGIWRSFRSEVKYKWVCTNVSLLQLVFKRVKAGAFELNIVLSMYPRYEDSNETKIHGEVARMDKSLPWLMILTRFYDYLFKHIKPHLDIIYNIIRNESAKRIFLFACRDDCNCECSSRWFWSDARISSLRVWDETTLLHKLMWLMSKYTFLVWLMYRPIKLLLTQLCGMCWEILLTLFT